MRSRSSRKRKRAFRSSVASRRQTSHRRFCRWRKITICERCPMNQLKMYIVSDSIGETGDLVAKAAISQFREDFESTAVKRIPHVESTDQLHEITELAAEQNAIILY